MQYFTMPHLFLQEWHRNPQEWAGIHRNETGLELDWNWNGQEWTGMTLEWIKMDILELRV